MEYLHLLAVGRSIAHFDIQHRHSLDEGLSTGIVKALMVLV